MHFIYLTGIVRLTETIWIWIIIMNLSGRYSTCEETGTRSRIAQSSILCTSKHVEANTRITVVCSANCKYTLIFWLSTLQRMTILGLAQSIWFYYKRGNRFLFFFGTGRLQTCLLCSQNVLLTTWTCIWLLACGWGNINTKLNRTPLCPHRSTSHVPLDRGLACPLTWHNMHMQRSSNVTPAKEKKTPLSVRSVAIAGFLWKNACLGQ